jgi:hypothetical protein
MKFKLIFLLLAILLCCTSVIAYEERDIFIIDEHGKASYQYRNVNAVEYEFYFESAEATLSLPETSINVKFEDSYGEIEAKYNHTKDGYDYYTIQTQMVEFDHPYFFGYSYDLPKNTVTRYKGNYFFSHPYYDEKDFNFKLSFCVPESAFAPAKKYDSSPDLVKLSNYNDEALYKLSEDLSFLHYTSEYEKLGSNQYVKLKSIEQQIYSVDVCPSGFKEYVPNFYVDGWVDLRFDFQIPDMTLRQKTESTGNIDATYPEIYDSYIKRNLPLIDKTLSQVSPLKGMNSITSYDLEFISENDEAFSPTESILAHEDGSVFYSTNLFRAESDEFFQVNILRGIILCNLLELYGEAPEYHWWTSGVATNLALKNMDEQGINTKELHEVLNDYGDSFDNITSEEIHAMLDGLESDSSIYFFSFILDKIDKICDNHVDKINNAMYNLGSSVELDEVQFNNFILHNSGNDCLLELNDLFDKYGFEHDSVVEASQKYDELLQEAESLLGERQDITLANILGDDLKRAKENLETGRVVMANKFLNNIESSDMTELKEALELLEHAEVKVEAIPFLFGFPSKTLAKSKLNAAVESMNSGNLKDAKVKIEGATFWGDSSIWATFFLIGVIALILWLVFRGRKKKFKLVRRSKI